MTTEAVFPDYKKASVGSLIPYARNSRTHSDAQVAKIAASIREFGFLNPVIVDGDNGIIAGHGRVLAAQKLGLTVLPVIEAAHLTEAQKRAYVIADNRLALDAGWDNEMLKVELSDLHSEGFNLESTGFDLSEISGFLDKAPNKKGFEEGVGGKLNRSLADRFLIPPFSVLNAREGWWQDRKRAWLELGIKSEVGRGENLLRFSDTINEPDPEKRKAKKGGVDAGLTFGAFSEEFSAPASGTSIFDPVLCELAYSWWCPPGGLILDPFAGGSVRGVVASKLERQYVGCELRAEQVEANRQQAWDICSDPQPVWHVTDSRRIDRVCADVAADMVFSCPPYADLEVYSDDPADLSTLPYEEFRGAYFEIIGRACKLLKPNRFACFVVGEVRDRKGNYYDFVGDTVQAFRDAGLHFYNEAILVTSAGSLPIRAGKQFAASRKLGKTHQNVLVFVKGDGKKAAEACGEVEVWVPPDPAEEGEPGENSDLGEEL